MLDVLPSPRYLPGMSQESDIALPSTSDGPKQFADYELISEIARGGMGVVYRAQQPKLKRTVALKLVLAGAFAGEEEIKRFHLEAEASANLDHPNIVPVYEVGQHAGHHYLSMKLIEGSSLADQLEDFKADQRKTAEFMITIARAMHHAHQRGVLHRDLKPDNILIDNEGRPYITDFGLAKHVDQDSGMTQTGAIMGTPTYMAPEQARGERNLTTSVDVYSLGAILYEMLTGRPPFQADTMTKLLIAAQREEPKRPRTINQKVDLDMETIALRCLSKEAENRYDSAAAMADDLERWLKGETIIARPVGAIERTLRWCKRNTALAGTAGVAVSLIALISLVFVAQLMIKNKQLSESMAAEKDARGKAEAAQRTAEENEIEAKRQEGVAKAETLKMRRHLYAASMNQIATAWETGDMQRVLGLLDATLPASTAGIDLRGWEWHYWHDQANAFERRLSWELEQPGWTQGLWATRDGKHLQSLVRLHNGGARRITMNLASGEQAEAPINTIHTKGMYVVAARSTNILATFGSHNKDGKINKDVRLTVYDSAGRALQALEDPGAVGRMVFDRKGQRLAYSQMGPGSIGSFSKAIHILNITSGNELAVKGTAVFTLPSAGAYKTVAKGIPHGGRVHALAFSPDGRKLASGAQDGTLRLWDTNTGTMLFERNVNYSVSAIAFNVDGSAFASADAGHKRVIVWKTEDGSRITQLSDPGDQKINALAFSPDGTQLAAGGADRNVRVWSIADGTQRIFKGHLKEIRSMVFLTNNRLYSQDNGPILEWDLDRQEMQRTLITGRSRQWVSMDFSPDGTHLGAASGYWNTWNLDTDERVSTAFSGKSAHGAVNMSMPCFAAMQQKSVLLVNPDASVRDTITPGHSDSIRRISISPDGRTLISASSNETIAWDLVDDRLIGKGPHMGRDTFFLTFTPDSKRVLFNHWYSSNVANVVHVWTPATGEVLNLKGNRRIRSAAGSFDGKRIAAVVDGTWARFYDTATGEQEGKQMFVGNAVWLAFHPDGTRLASAHDQDGIKLWDIQTGQELLAFKDPAARFALVRFSPDGRHLAAVDVNNRIQLWSIGEKKSATSSQLPANN
jgi:WD40 repeat protein/predicted Ser/Thr protein kinase